MEPAIADSRIAATKRSVCRSAPPKIHKGLQLRCSDRPQPPPTPLPHLPQPRPHALPGNLLLPQSFQLFLVDGQQPPQLCELKTSEATRCNRPRLVATIPAFVGELRLIPNDYLFSFITLPRSSAGSRSKLGSVSWLSLFCPSWSNNNAARGSKWRSRPSVLNWQSCPKVLGKTMSLLWASSNCRNSRSCPKVSGKAVR